MGFNKEEYLKDAHRIQTGVAIEIEAKGVDNMGANPKHLRTGLNMAMADHSSLAKLLIRKGIITDEEYLNAIQVGTREEADRIVQSLRAEGILPENANVG